MACINHPIQGVTYTDPESAKTYLSSGSWVDMTVGQALHATAERYPDRPAFISDDRNISFRALDQKTNRLGAALLDLGLETGDRAIFQMGTNIETVIALVACYRIGVVPVCSVPQYREVEISQLTERSAAKGYFVQADFSSFDLVDFAQRMIVSHDSLQHLIVSRANAGLSHGSRLEQLIGGISADEAQKRIQAVQLGSGDVLSFQLSGGTTGVPKIIPRFHAEYLGHSTGWMRRYELDSDSRLIWSLPLLHNAGQLYALIPALLHGVTIVLMPRVDIPRMLELIEEHRVTHALSVGPIAPQLMAYQDIRRHDLSSLRLFATMTRAESLERHIGVPCSNLYGTTEGLLLGSSAGAPAHARHYTHGASGCGDDDQIRLLEPGSEQPVALGEPGELCFRGPSSLRGYYAAPEATAKAFTSDGFLRTGDIMTAYETGGEICYAFEGRLRDNVNRGGEKIGCEEVEAYVSLHPAVADAKLVAMPDPIYGEKGCIYLILRQGATAPAVKELAEFLIAQGLAKFKCPERIELIDEFPITRVGKLDKSALRAMIARVLESESESVSVHGDGR